jgi:serine/threonine protein kinase
VSTAAAGLLVGSWELREEIGHGGQATVHGARHAILGRPAAVKLIHRAVWADPAFRVRFQRECDALAAIDHPHVIPVYDAGECEGRGYLVMRLARDGSLAARLRDGAMRPAEALRLLRAIAEALDAVHAEGRVHRDVTPANILLDPAGGPWLGDFGLARRIDATIATGEGTLVGTAAYLAPEVIAGGRAGPEADRYALAAVAFHALTGRAPFVAPDLAGVLYGHMHHDPPPVRELQPHLPPALDGALRAGLARMPGRRPSTAGALVDIIARALGDTRTGGAVPPTPVSIAPTHLLPGPEWAPITPASRRRRGRRALARATATGLAVLVGVGGGLAYTQRDNLPFVAEASAEPPRVTTVPGADGIDVPAALPVADDLPAGVSRLDAVAATVGDVRVISLPGGAAAFAAVRDALAADGHRASEVRYEGRPVGIETALPWGFFVDAESYGLMVLREPAGERAIVVRGDGDAVRQYMAGVAAAVGARILPAS